MIVIVLKWIQNSIGKRFLFSDLMKIPKTFGLLATGLLGLSFFLVSCSDPQKVARKSLDAKGYDVSTASLLLAASAGDAETIGLFQAAGVEVDSVDEVGNTALMKASSGGHLQAVEKILGMGADPRMVNKAGRDALISAASKGHEEVARVLMSRGADTTIRDAEGWGALSIAAYNGHAGVVSLLSATATPAELDDALLVASFSGDGKVLNTLLGQGANINARSPDNKTPLMISSQAGKVEAVRILLQNQANPYAIDHEQKTAAALATAAGFEDVSKLISNPDTWGTSTEGLKAASEMSEAQKALAESGVEEVLQAAPEEAIPDPTLVDGPSPSKDPAPAPDSVLVELSSPTTPSSASPVAQTGEFRSDLRPEISGNSAGSVAPPIRNSEIAKKVREESKSRPIVALNGSTIHARTPEEAPVKSMVLAAYHEESLPIAVERVDGRTASVRRLDQPAAGSFEVTEGTVIPGTTYQVKEVTTRFVSSKEGKGRMVDVSRVRVEDTRKGSTHLLVKDVVGQTSDTYAILAVPNSQYRYVVKPGDVFRTTQPEVGTKDYQVLDIRPTAVVIKDLATDEVLSIARDGVVNPY